jgi:hypothetical protein
MPAEGDIKPLFPANGEESIMSRSSVLLVLVVLGAVLGAVSGIAGEV